MTLVNATTGLAIGDAPAVAAAPGGAAPSQTVIPTHDAFGAALTARQQFDMLLQDPAWVAGASVPTHPAFAQRQDLDRRMLAEAEASGAAPAAAQSGDEFRLPWRGDETPEELAWDAPMRSWLQTAGFDANSGTSIAETASELARKVDRWEEADFTRHANESRAALAQAFGDQLDAKLDAVADMLVEVEQKHPELQQFLEAQPWLLRDSLIVAQLIRVADARAARW